MNKELVDVLNKADYDTLLIIKREFAKRKDKEVVSAIDEVIKDRNYDDMKLWEE